MRRSLLVDTNPKPENEAAFAAPRTIPFLFTVQERAAIRAAVARAIEDVDMFDSEFDVESLRSAYDKMR